ncbi:MAG: clan AA aspartic protease [Cyanobacteria bacterium P01_F01_bin.150]
MILGTVNNNREAVIQIAVLNDSQQAKGIRAVIDTGYTGDLMLPRTIVEELELILRGVQDATLGDGSLALFEMYAGFVNLSESECLVGMGLLEEYKLEIEGRAGGLVKITALL